MIVIDGNAYNNPGGTGGYAGIAQYPEAWNRESEIVFQVGFEKTTNNRMELKACIHAYRYVVDNGKALNIQRVQIVTDSQYVFKFQFLADTWRQKRWRLSSGAPVENADLWKEFLSVRSKACATVRTELIWRKGKKSAILKAVDKACKEAGKQPTEKDRGYRSGKLAKTKVTEKGTSLSFPAQGQEAVIRIYRKNIVGRAKEDKIFFDLLEGHSFIAKYRAFNHRRSYGGFDDDIEGLLTLCENLIEFLVRPLNVKFFDSPRQIAVVKREKIVFCPNTDNYEKQPKIPKGLQIERKFLFFVFGDVVKILDDKPPTRILNFTRDEVEILD